MLHAFLTAVQDMGATMDADTAKNYLGLLGAGLGVGLTVIGAGLESAVLARTSPRVSPVSPRPQAPSRRRGSSWPPSSRESPCSDWSSVCCSSFSRAFGASDPAARRGAPILYRPPTLQGHGGRAGGGFLGLERPRRDVPDVPGMRTMRLRLSLLTLRRLLLATPALLIAQEHAAAEGGGGLFSINLGLSVWTIVIFLSVLIVLWRFAFPAILRCPGCPGGGINALEEARARQEEAQRLLEEHKRELADARRQAQEILAEGREAAGAPRERAGSKSQGRGRRHSGPGPCRKSDGKGRRRRFAPTGVRGPGPGGRLESSFIRSWTGTRTESWSWTSWTASQPRAPESEA